MAGLKAFVTQYTFETRPLYYSVESLSGAETDGFCYLRWFSCYTVKQQNAAKRCLGAYPPVRDVVKRLQLVLRHDVSVEAPVLVDGVWHVVGGGVLVPSSQIIGRFMFDKPRTDHAVPKMRVSVGTTAAMEAKRRNARHHALSPQKTNR